MNFGLLTIIVAFMTSLISGYFYYSAARGDVNSFRIGRLIYKITLAIITFSSIYFLYLILTHSFQYDYIYRYSSRSLPFFYLISSFWAGQEGSFLLWTLFISIMGFLYLRSSSNLEPWSMLFILVVQAFFLFLMIHKSPFELLPILPPDGAGLNPLLQDPWMVIHPPILFLGYAAITIPFALAMAALIRKDFNGWIQQALAWSLFSSITLGAGIIIGGFWAYEVLGWGGYWGWDPVENSSLIPWLTILALFHGLIVQKFKNALPKFNLVLAVLTFVLVIYATFLTRSGMLADFSVHSFQNNGQNIYLISFMVGVLLLSAFFFFKNYSLIRNTKIDMFSLIRESGLLWGIIALCLSALIVFIGTSWPIITRLFASSSSSVDISVYNKLNFPIAIVIALLIAITPYLIWGKLDIALLIKRLINSGVLTIISVIIGLIFGVKQFSLMFFIMAASFAFWTNIFTIIDRAKISWLDIGGPLSHVGVGLLFLGIIVSGNYDEHKRVQLQPNDPVELFGYKLKYIGATENPNGKTQINIDVEKNGNVFHSHPKLYFSKYNNAWMREPDIKILLLNDLYISVLERKQNDEAMSNKLVLTKGETKKFSDYEIEFLGFDFGNHQMATTVSIGANLKVRYSDNIYVLKPEMIYENNKKFTPIVYMPSQSEEKRSVIISNIDADKKMVELTFGGTSLNDEDVPERIVVEVSTKPFMNFVWAGSILLTLGTIIAFSRRMKI